MIERSKCVAAWLSALLVCATCGGDLADPDADTDADAASDADAEGITDADADADSDADGGDADADSDADGGDADADSDADGGDADSDTETPPYDGPFWRLEDPPDSVRTWLVSPEGARTFVLGVNTVMRGKNCDGMVEDWIRRAPPTETANIEWARLSDGESQGHTVERPYCFNAIDGFSDTNEFDDSGGDSYMVRPVSRVGTGAPYTIVLYPSAGGDDRTLRNEHGTPLRSGYAELRIGDPYNPAFLEDLRRLAAEKCAPRAHDPQLIMYYAGNEIGLFDRADPDEPGVRDLRQWIWSDCPAGSSPAAPLCARHGLAAFLSARYAGSLPSLNDAWDSDYPGTDFGVIVDRGPRPVPYEHDCSQTCREDLARFVHQELLPRWIRAVTTAIRAADPNHLVSSPRLALAKSTVYRFWTPASRSSPDVWAEHTDVPLPTDSGDVHYSPFDLFSRSGDSGFDIVAVNVYNGDHEIERPWFTDGIHRIQNDSGLPTIVSEFGVRARISGWSNQGGSPAFVPDDDDWSDQAQRGARYQSQIEQFISFRRMVGANWHAWSDRYVAADPSYQINMGLVRCNDPSHGYEAGERWGELDERIAEINCNILAHIEAAIGPEGGTDGSGCTATETMGCAAFGCSCVDHECRGGSGCEGSGCTATETMGCAAFGCGCTDHECHGGSGCEGTGCTTFQTYACAAFGCGCADMACSGGSGCEGSGCTLYQAYACGAFGCGCADMECSGGTCGGTGCTLYQTYACAAFGCGCLRMECTCP